MKTTLAITSDIHYYSPRLGTEGRAYELRSSAALPNPARWWTPRCKAYWKATPTRF